VELIVRRRPSSIVHRPPSIAALVATVLFFATPLLAVAQDMPPSVGGSRFQPWFVAGAGSTTLLGDCTDCEADTYFHSASVLANAGVSISRRTDFGAEILWVPQTLGTGDRIRVTYLMAAVQFRPWQTRGFFLKAGSGMAFLRNWLDAVDQTAPPIRSKAFALGLGAGWEWRTSSRLGMQVFGSQHAAALGDLQTSERTAQNVMGNFWSVGAAVVIR
jgi:hypothetical protein